ncbi:MAG: hypothetical protein IJ809_03810 [Clostridia bacterium]|nr:hypothetical protein [Clostridia bacterium]
MFLKDDVKKVADMLNVNFVNFTLDDLTFAMNEELEHGTNYESTNITNDNIVLTAKIALAHLNAYPNYYNKEYGLPNLEKTLKEKLNEEQYFEKNITIDDEIDKEC